MRYYVRTSRHTGVSFPFWVYLVFVWPFQLLAFMGVLMLWLLGALVEVLAVIGTVVWNLGEGIYEVLGRRRSRLITHEYVDLSGAEGDEVDFEAGDGTRATHSLQPATSGVEHLGAYAIQTRVEFDEHKRAVTGVIVITDTPTRRITAHWPWCERVTARSFETKVIANHGRNGRYYYFSRPEEAISNLSPEPCQDCRPWESTS